MRAMVFVVPVVMIFCTCDILVPATGQEHQRCFGDGTCLGELQCSMPDNTCIGIEEDCEAAVCSPSSAGFDCGTSCFGATEVCISGQCVVLIWQNQPAGNEMIWQEAIDYCTNLTQDDHSDWHLPTISELRSLIRGCPATETGGACGITDSCLSESSCQDSACDGCSGGDGPAGGCYWPDEMQGDCSWYYWSASYAGDSSHAWHVRFDSGHIYSDSKDGVYNVRCVR